MAKDPAFLFYTGDFTTGTQFMTDEQVGKYIRLLMAQHQLGHLKESHVLQICKSYDNDVMSKFVKDADGLWYNERLENEIVKRKNYSKSRAENRSGKNNISKTHDVDMENKNIDTSLDIIKESKPKILGTGKLYFIVDKKYVNGITYKVQGVDGLKEYMSENESVLNYPQFAEKFMKKYNGAKFNDFMHVFFTYNKFTDNA
jgi:uncharacterized protein YdaU (DUF1376 family)